MGGVSKPNIKLGGKTLFEYVLDAFCQSNIDEIVVVCSEDNRESLTELSKNVTKPVSFVLGGKTRAQSVKNGVSASGIETKIVCVHDCARPFITPSVINRAIESACKTGASCVCSAVTDTLKGISPKDGTVYTLDRSRIFAVQTPQCFKKSLYFEACESSGDLFDSFTDETSLLEHHGVSVEYVKNEEINLKLTTKSDIELAEGLITLKNSKKGG